MKATKTAHSKQKEDEHVECSDQSTPPANGSAASLQRRKRMMKTVLWMIQGCLALLFLFRGSIKLILPVQMLMAQVPLPLPGPFLKFIGLAEVMGAAGLILPGLLRTRPMLTPLAACGLLMDMMGATAVTLLGEKGTAALLPLVIGLLCAAIAHSRWFILTAAYPTGACGLTRGGDVRLIEPGARLLHHLSAYVKAGGVSSQVPTVSFRVTALSSSPCHRNR